MEVGTQVESGTVLAVVTEPGTDTHGTDTDDTDTTDPTTAQE